MEYRLEYRFVSATRSSLHSAAALPLPTCRHFQPAALTCRRLVKTFNPMVVGSIPTRPTRGSQQESLAGRGGFEAASDNACQGSDSRARTPNSPSRLLRQWARAGRIWCRRYVPHPRTPAPIPDTCHVAHARRRLPCQRRSPPWPRGRDAGAPPDDDRAAVRQAAYSRAHVLPRRRRSRRDRLLRRLRPGARLVAQPSARSAGKRADRWDDLEGNGETATPEEHDRLWPLVTTTHPGYARYQERTTRLIPIVMLRPEDAETATRLAEVDRTAPGERIW